MRKLILRFAFLAVILAASRGQATTYTPTIITDPAVSGGVNSGNGVITGGAGNGQVSLRSAIIAANAHAGADSITLPAGTYTLALLGNDATCQAGDLDINDSLIINGVGAATTIIQGATDAAFTSSIGDKIIGINQDGTHPSLAVGINNVTIRYGRNTIANNDPQFAYTGAGVDVFLTGAGNNIGFTNCVIANNQNVNAYGGGVNVDSANGGVAAGTVTFNGCTIVSNSTMSTTFTATGAGVNLFADLHNVTFINCVIANNQAATSGTAGTGGGINIRHTNGGTVTVNNCVITNNTAIAGGGGILTAVKQTVNITGGSISGNSAGTGGGGLFCGTGVGTTTLNNVIISGNHANTSTGGGILDTATAALILNNCVITSNTAGTGGGIHVSGGNLTANYCRIVNNTATTGKAVAQSAGTANVVNNWWGTNAPAALMSGTLNFTPWLQLTHTANPNTIFVPNAITLTASFLTNSAGTTIAAGNLSALTSAPVVFNNPVRGTLSGAQAAIQASGTGTATFTANAAGAGSADATVDNQTITAAITIPTGVSSINRAQTTPTNLTSVSWTVTFTNAVSGVALGNFSLVNVGLGGSPAITSVTAVGGAPATSWTVTASTGSGTGTLGLNMANGTGVSASMVNLPFTGQLYTIDLLAPNTSITAQPPSLTNSLNASFSFTGSDTGAGVASFQYQLDGSAFTIATSPVNLTGLSSASHTFSVRAIDGAGNIDPSPATATWTVDTILPTVNCSTDFTVVANGSCPRVVNFAVSVSDNLALSLATTNPASGSVFPLGTNTVTLTARDTAGNTNFCTFKVIVQPGAAPQLNILRAGTNAVVSWSNAFPCYTLQFAPRLSSNSWSSYLGPFTTNGGNIYVTNSVAFTNRFFRLSF